MSTSTDCGEISLLSVSAAPGPSSCPPPLESVSDIEVTVAATAADARDILAEESHDCVLVDTADANTSRAVVRTLCDAAPELPILVITEPAAATSAIDAGATDVIRRVDGRVDGQLLHRRIARIVGSPAVDTPFRTVYEHSMDGIAIHDETGEIRCANRQFHRLLGYDPEGSPELRLDRIAADVEPYTAARAREHVRRTLEEGVQVFEWLAETKEGERFLAEVALKPMTLGGERHVVEFVRDISDQKCREQYLEVMHRLLRHDLRNDLNVVMGEADRLADELDDPERAAEAAAIHDRLSQVATLSEKADVIERTVQQRGSAPESIDIREPVQEALEAVRAEYPEAVVDADVAAGIEAAATDDITFAVREVLSNAIEHDEAAAPHVEVVATGPDGASEGSREVQVSVRDWGPGIPDEEWEIVTGERDISQLQHASGLGLWLARWIVESVDGRLSRDVNDDGTTVTLHLQPGEVRAD